MKKLGAFLFLLLLVITGLSLWMLGQTGPDKADAEMVTTEIEDNFEK